MYAIVKFSFCVSSLVLVWLVLRKWPFCIFLIRKLRSYSKNAQIVRIPFEKVNVTLVFPLNYHYTKFILSSSVLCWLHLWRVLRILLVGKSVFIVPLSVPTRWQLIVQMSFIVLVKYIMSVWKCKMLPSVRLINSWKGKLFDLFHL